LGREVKRGTLGSESCPTAEPMGGGETLLLKRRPSTLGSETNKRQFCECETRGNEMNTMDEGGRAKLEGVAK